MGEDRQLIPLMHITHMHIYSHIHARTRVRKHERTHTCQETSESSVCWDLLVFSTPLIQLDALPTQIKMENDLRTTRGRQCLI